MDLKKFIRTVPDFPKKGIMFRDITTLLKDAKAFRYAIEKMKAHYVGQKIDFVVAPESRGFIFGAVLAHELNVGFVPVRKHGKLPAETLFHEYELEYGKDKVEIHKDSFGKGAGVLIVDDLLATGGTAIAAAKLVEKLGGKIAGSCFLINLAFLPGEKKLKAEGIEVFSLIEYDSE